MDLAIKILIGLLSVPLAGLGMKTMFMPKSMVEKMGVEPHGAHGLNTMRADIGGLLLSSAALLVLGLVTMNTAYFLAVAVVMGVVALGRVIGLAVDGFDKDVVPPLVVELVLVAVLVVAHLRFG